MKLRWARFALPILPISLLLATLTCRTRAEFLEDIPKLTPAIVALGGEEALRGVVGAMRQVCGWWP